MTWLKFVNIFFFQWFFVRLTKCSVDRVEDYKLLSYDLTASGMASRGEGTVKTYVWYCIQYWILPTTGWGNNFYYISKTPKFIKITKEYEKKDI